MIDSLIIFVADQTRYRRAVLRSASAGSMANSTLKMQAMGAGLILTQRKNFENPFVKRQEGLN
ncbi:hypothetical protein ACFQPC_02690 [Herminiimonas glaciei]|uniref:Uncharacterized protein n=1 Tax=Herminiimonas glaciei TaxID=523788 RepID=A0ABW2I7E1_9BURK